MNKYFRKSVSGEFAATCLLFSFLLLPAQPAGAALSSARITQVIRDVNLVPSSATPRPAAINDDVREGTAVRTGQDSRTELTFTDKTLMRLGANSIFSFNVGAGAFDLGQGSILMQVPPNGSSVKVKTAAVTAAITGGTAIFGTGPPIKFMVLEGTGTFYPAGHPEEAVTLHSGEMVTLTPDGHLVGPVAFDVKKVLETSELIINFPDLANLPLILAVIREQEALYAANPPPPPPPKDTTEVVDEEIAASATPTPTPEPTPTPTPEPTPSGTPGKYGPPSVISSPVPYVITSGTTITTDPSITTNGQTDYGTIYRDQSQDGPFTTWAFGSTSTFDTASGFDDHIDNSGAVFKFTSLQLTGNPAVSTTAGVINLGLIGVNGVTSGGPGGILTFAGINGLLIATQNGSINLGSEISFAGLHDIGFYARGSGSNLTLGSAISTSSDVHLFSQGNIQVNGDVSTTNFTAFSGGDFLVGTGMITAQSIDVESLANVNVDSRQFPNVTGDVTFIAADTLNATLYPGSGGTSHFTGTSLTAQGNTINLQGTVNPTTFDLETADVSVVAGSGGIQAPTILFANGSSLLLQATGDINIYGTQNGSGSDTIMAGGAFTAQSDVSALTVQAGTTINVVGELSSPSISAGSDVTAGNIQAAIDNSGGLIGADATVTVNAGSISALGGDFDATISNVAGNIGGSATINEQATGNISTQGGLDATINNTGGQIANDASIAITSSGAVTAQGDATFQILNSDNGNGGSPGQIGGNATIDITTGADFTANSLTVLINDRHGGAIGNDATLDLNIGGALTIQNDAIIGISTRNDGTGGGTIGSDTTVNVDAGSVSVGGAFTTFVSAAGGGNITGSATNRVNATGDLVVQGPILVEILDPGFNQINPVNFIAPAHIGGDATVTLSAQNIITSSTASGVPGSDIMALEASIYPNGSGTIGGNAIVNVLASQNITAPGTVFFTVANGNYMGTGGGTIGGDAEINVSAANLSTGDLFADIYNYGGASIGGNAALALHVLSSLNVNGSLDAVIDNTGGTIGGNATIDMNLTNNTNLAPTATVSGDATVQILGNDPTGSAAINFNGGSYDVGGTFLSTIDGNGTITFSNAAIQADIVKVGVFGANGTLMIGGGHISGDTLLRLYAPGSNGMIDFVANVTLSNQSSAVIIAAKIVTIFNGVVVTIGGPTSASVFTDVPNYTGSGGNGSTTGIFAGTGATTQPLANAPDFNSPPPSGTPSEFGPPSVISSPVPYVITSGTAITTDPTITTNGVTDYGKIYRDSETDGPFSAYAFGSTSTFDTTSGFDDNIDNSGAVFKFTSLQLTGNPTVSTINGETSLALIGVNGVTSGGPGGTLTFTGIDGLLIATENGSINLGSEISFSGSHDLNFYARGSGSSLTLASAISGITNLRLFSEGTIQINGAISTTNFNVFSGGDFLTPTATITATNIDIHSLSNITLDAQLIPDAGGGPINLNAANTLTINNMNGGVYGRDSLTAQATTINLQPTESFATFDFSQSSSVTLTAGTGGINASGIDFFGHNLTLESGGDIDIYSARTPSDINENQILDGTIDAAGNITSVGDVDTGTIHSGGSTTVGGRLLAGDISADVDVSGAQGITAVGGSIVAGGNITSQNGTIELQQNPPGTFGNITAGGNIFAGGGIFTPGDPVVVSAGGSITAPGVITGTLQAGTDITIDNTAENFGFGIIANHIIAGGTLFMMNSPTISPNNGGSGGNDGETFDDFTMTVGSIVSTGPTYPILSSNGGDANPNFDDSNPGNGGHITLTITAGGLSIGDGNDLNSIQAKGGAFNTNGPFVGGNGGTVDIIAAGNVLIENRSSDHAGITATTGIVSDIFSQYGGNGGTVNITAAGSLSVNGNIKVSSDDAGEIGFRPLEGDVSGRESASGGTIYLQSNLTTGTGITVTSNGELLSLLSAAAPGAGGSITLSTLGADIIVNGTVRADFGTVTIDQDDPPATTPTITLDGGTVQAATFNINGSGDLTIGPNNATAINIFGGTWNVAHDITINAANTSFAYSFALNATAGDAINFTGGSSGAPATLTLPLSGDTTFTAGAGGINAQFTDVNYSGAGLNLMSGGDITANSITFTDSFARGNVNAAGAISITGNLWEGDISAGTSLNVGGGIIGNAITAGTTITAGQYISATSLTAGGDITADITRVQYITSPTGVLRAASGIYPSIFSTAPGFPQGAAAPHIYTVDSIVSPNGIDFSGNQFDGIAGFSSGGLLTINANSLSFDPSTGIGPVNFNGADQNGFSNGTTPTLPGDGGNLTVNTTGTIVVNSDIEATSGYFQPVPSATPAGFGGTVDLNSSGDTVTVNNRIEVSSAEPASTIAPFRQSARGGNINLTSGKTSGVAINVSSSAQLLSLLSAAAPGPGGKITILASASNNSGNSSSINIDNSNGLIAADGSGGTVDIEHNGDSGTININNANIRADVVKVGAFGDNGTLNIGGGTINADTMLKLYATGSNGSVNFIADVTLSGASTKIIAGNSVTIFNSVVVTIGGPAATVYTSHPNYTGSGGNNSTTGIFSGSGATTVPSGTPPPF